MEKRINELTKGVGGTSKSKEVELVTSPSKKIRNKKKIKFNLEKKWSGKNNLKEKHLIEKN